MMEQLFFLFQLDTPMSLLIITLSTLFALLLLWKLQYAYTAILCFLSCFGILLELLSLAMRFHHFQAGFMRVMQLGYLFYFVTLLWSGLVLLQHYGLHQQIPRSNKS